MTHVRLFLPCALALLGGAAALAAESAPAPAPGQQLVLAETNPLSPRHSALTGPADSGEVLRTDLDADGDPDVLECWWNGKRARWFDENDDMRPTDTRGDVSADSVQIDRDGDGYYDGPGDMNVKWVDSDGDGDPDLQLVAMNPSAAQKSLYAGESHWMIFVDLDDDNVNGYIDWQKFTFENWKITGKGNFSPDYNGNGAFLKEHLPAAFIADPRFNWENPFAFFDEDGDGVSEMAIRLLDDAIKNPPANGGDGYDESTGWRFDGKIDEAFVTFDLDNDSQKGNEMDYDLTLKMESRSAATQWDYSRYVHKIPGMRAPEWVLPFYRYTNWRKIDELIYVPQDKAYDELFRHRYQNAYLTFDEDDDDHRWERVELYYPQGDPYSTARGQGLKGGGLDLHPQSDTLGDRGEWDLDFSGGGNLYIGRWDQKIHLAGAERGGWTVDRYAKYWGSSPVAGDSSPDKAPKVGEVVLYKDTDGNGFFDEINYDYDGDKTVDLHVSLLDYATKENPHPDAAPLFSPARKHWKGMHALYDDISNRSFQDALVLYRAAWQKSLTTPEMDQLATAASVAEKYDHGYWLKEDIFRDLNARLAGSPNEQANLKRLYFTGDIAGVARFVESRAWPRISE
jgi:hypothetical protein